VIAWTYSENLISSCGGSRRLSCGQRRPSA
jgi:hypothetical protein